MTKQTTKSLRKVLVGAALAGALTVQFAGVATAAGDGAGPASKSEERSGAKGAKSDGGARVGGDKADRTTVAGLQSSCQENIARRLADLDRLEAKLAKKADVLTPEHAAAITLIVAGARTGLTALGGEIGAATTIDVLKPLCNRIVTDFRIYALRIPQANLVIAADALVAKQATFATLRTKLEAAILESGTPENADAVAALLVEFDDQVAAMAAAATTVPDGVLVLIPADYNADRKVLKPFVAATKEAWGEAKLASKTARKVLHLLAGDTEAEKEHGWGEGRHDSDK